jgi:hypothetical protein
MAQSKPPAFDPTKPFTEVAVPVFDPTKPFTEVAVPVFDPTKPFTEVSSTVPSAPSSLAERAASAIAAEMQKANTAFYGNLAGQVTGLASAVLHPLETVKSIATLPYHLPDIYQADRARAQSIWDASADKSVAERLKAALAVLVPFAGPMIAEEGLSAAAGHGMALATGAQAITRATGAAGNMVRGATPANPAVARAVAWLREKGVPVPAGVATGNDALTGMTELSDKSTVTGSMIAQRSTEQARQKLTGLMDEAASRVAQSPVTEERAGQAVMDRITGRVDRLREAAKKNYDQFDRDVAAAAKQTRSIAPGQPFQSMQAPVDLRHVKSALRGELNKYQAQIERIGTAGINPQQAAVMRQIDKLVNQAGDFAPLSEVENAVRELKRLQRATNNYDANAVISRAVYELDSRVLKAARAISPKTEAALVKARESWRQMLAADEQSERLLSGLKQEPGRLYNKMKTSGDDALAFLREVRDLAPQEMGKVGRAYLDTIMARVRESGFTYADGILRDLRALGPESKKILFADAIKADPAFLTNLDNLAVGMSRMAKQFNRSGSGHTIALTSHGIISGAGAAAGGVMGGASGAAEGFAASLATSALTDAVVGKVFSGLMRNPTFVRLMADGLRSPAARRYAATSASVARDSALAKLFSDAMRAESAMATAPIATNSTSPSTGSR